MMHNNRHIGLDLLRIIAMLMIVMQHFLTHNAALSGEMVSLNYYVGMFIRTICSVAVDCYFLITGYFMITHKARIEKVIGLWGETLFWSILVFGIMRMFVSVNTTELLYTFLPISMKEYWFITVYIVLYILTPYFNLLIKSMSRLQYKTLIAILLLVFSIWKMIVPTSSTLDSSGGYGLPIAVVMYFMGAYIKKYNIRIKQKYNIFICIIVPIIQMMTYLIIESMEKKFIWLGDYLISDILSYYTSICMIICAVSYFMLFKNIKIKNKIIESIIINISPLTLGVYLIHEQILLRKYLWKTLIPVERLIKEPYFIAMAIISVILVFVICCILEYIRKICTKKLRLDKIVNIIADKVKKLSYKLMNINNK